MGLILKNKNSTRDLNITRKHHADYYDSQPFSPINLFPGYWCHFETPTMYRYICSGRICKYIVSVNF